MADPCDAVHCDRCHEQCCDFRQRDGQRVCLLCVEGELALALAREAALVAGICAAQEVIEARVELLGEAIADGTWGTLEEALLKRERIGGAPEEDE